MLKYVFHLRQMVYMGQQYTVDHPDYYRRSVLRAHYPKVSVKNIQ